MVSKMRGSGCGTTAGDLSKWSFSFGTINKWVSEGVSHFQNDFIKDLNQEMKFEHHFCLPTVHSVTEPSTVFTVN